MESKVAKEAFEAKQSELSKLQELNDKMGIEKAELQNEVIVLKGKLEELQRDVAGKSAANDHQEKVEEFQKVINDQKSEMVKLKQQLADAAIRDCSDEECDSERREINQIRKKLKELEAGENHPDSNQYWSRNGEKEAEMTQLKMQLEEKDHQLFELREKILGEIVFLIYI